MAPSSTDDDSDVHWLGPVSALGHGAEARPRLPLRAAMARAAGFLAFWLMVSGWSAADLPVGIAAVGLATWTSLRFLPALPMRPRWAALTALGVNFFRQSVVSGTDVARRALSPDMRLSPGFVRCPLRLPPGGARSAFCALSSLMPGTLPTGDDESGALLVHGLDVRQPIAANLSAEEELFIRAVGND
jgi:multicomponent Na+:H+ antiporter subunit E